MPNRKNLCCLPAVVDPLVQDESFYILRKYQGQIIFWGKKDAAFPFGAQVGPDWYCMLVTYGLIFVSSYFFIVNVCDDWGLGLIIPAILTSSVLLISFTFTACSNPGIIFESKEDRVESGSDETLLDCTMCNIKRPATSYHCYDCGVCVSHLDHHCPWTGKCIGRDNIKYFHAFLTLLSAQIAFVVVMTIVSVATGKDIYN